MKYRLDQHCAARSRVTGWVLLCWMGVGGCVEPTARPLLWRVEGQPSSYVYGTIHVPDARVLALPPVVKKALAACDAFYAEVPLERKYNRLVDQRSRLPEGQTLDQVLPAALYARTEQYFRSKGVSLKPLSNRKVWMVAASLSLLDYLWDFVWRTPLDQKLYDWARVRGREVGGLETIEEQLAIFDSLSDEEQAAFLEKTLELCERAAASGTSYARQAVDAYLRGEESELMAELRAGSNLDTEAGRKLFERLVTERNQRLAERMIGHLRKRPDRSFFFAIGAGHLMGPEGVVARLEQAGYVVRRLTPADSAGCLSRESR